MDQINPAFHFDYILDVLWADASCRKNCAISGEMVSFDSTCSTNRNNMIFCPLRGIKHHRGYVFYGATLNVNEKIQSYRWVFQTFLKEMDGATPMLLVIGEYTSMKAAVEEVMSTTVHRLCMCHIMKRLPERLVLLCGKRNISVSL